MLNTFLVEDFFAAVKIENQFHTSTTLIFSGTDFQLEMLRGTISNNVPMLSRHSAVKVKIQFHYPNERN